jgi:hypothetical protein
VRRRSSPPERVGSRRVVGVGDADLAKPPEFPPPSPLPPRASRNFRRRPRRRTPLAVLRGLAVLHQIAGNWRLAVQRSSERLGLTLRCSPDREHSRTRRCSPVFAGVRRCSPDREHSRTRRCSPVFTRPRALPDAPVFAGVRPTASTPGRAGVGRCRQCSSVFTRPRALPDAGVRRCSPDREHSRTRRCWPVSLVFVGVRRCSSVFA